MGADASKHYTIFWTRINTHSPLQPWAVNLMLYISLAFWSVSRWSLLMISWGSLPPTLALGKELGILLQVTSFYHVQNCVANNKWWAVFVRRVFVLISNGNFQQNLICILLSCCWCVSFTIRKVPWKFLFALYFCCIK